MHVNIAEQDLDLQNSPFLVGCVIPETALIEVLSNEILTTVVGTVLCCESFDKCWINKSYFFSMLVEVAGS